MVEGKWCRRQVLDRVKDGWLDRTECEMDEEVCDICTKRKRIAVMAEEMMIKREEEDEAQASVAMDEMVTSYQRQRRRAEFEERRAIRKTMEAATEAVEFRGQLERWASRCVVCHWKGEEEYHEMETCPRKGSETWEQARERMADVEEGLFTKRRFADYSACFPCGMPQEICDRWEAQDDDGGTYRLIPGAKCQHKGLMVKVYGGAMAHGTPQLRELMDEMCKERGWTLDDEDEIFTWLGGKIKWGGMDTNRACQWVHRFCQLLEGVR